MKSAAIPFLFLLAFSTSACYHAKIITDLPPSDDVVEEKWLVGFVNGLVMTEEMDVSDECPAGVALVETKVSFMNQLVTFLTGGIFSPMSVEVTCAAEALDIGENMILGENTEQAMNEAANRSLLEQKPVYVQIGAQVSN